ncbi:MAG: extracellular solute-binding protein [Spirochaetales bacterium]|nr:extracellular solute-binding protein [Spirochaetales bacterium]
MKKNLHILIMDSSTLSTSAFNEEVSHFKEENPGYDFELEIISWQYGFQKIVQSVKHGSGPDIVQLGNSWIGALSMIDSFDPLEGSKIELDKNNFFPAAFEMGFMPRSEKLIAVPWLLDGRIFYYNRKMLEKAGFKLEENTTWDGMMDLFKQIKSAKMMPFCCFRFSESMILQEILPWIWNFGGDVFSPDFSRIIIDEPSSFEGIKRYFELLTDYSITHDGVIMESLYDRFFSTNDFVFISGQSWPLFVFFNSLSPEYKNDVVQKINIMHRPAGPANNQSFIGGSLLAVPKYSRNKEAACRFLNYLVSTESQVRYAMSAGAHPANIFAFEKMAEKMSLDADILTALIYNSRSYPNHPLWSLIDNQLSHVFVGLLNKIFAGSYTENELRSRLSELRENLEFLVSL